MIEMGRIEVSRYFFPVGKMEKLRVILSEKNSYGDTTYGSHV